MTKVFDKTEKGREEIATRKYHLAPRVRTLLVMIDGKQNADDLLKKLSGLGITEQAITELVQEGFISDTASSAAPTSADDAEATTHTTNHPVALVAPPPTAETVLPAGQTQYEAIYRFYNETIKSTIGLRGYGLQLKVERAASIDDFRQLKKPYLDAVLKAQGPEMARSLRDRLDTLLYLGEPVPENAAVAASHS